MGKLRYIFSSPNSGRPYCRRAIPQQRIKDDACIVLDGMNVVYASETERFTKVKHDHNVPVFPFENYCKYNESSHLEETGHTWVPAHHHLDHIYEAFYQSGFDDAAIIVEDGSGNLDDCITIAYMKKGEQPQIFKKFDKSTSPCHFYWYAALKIFKDISQGSSGQYSEGKLMGLAGYGNEKLADYIKFNQETLEIDVSRKKFVEDLNKCKNAGATSQEFNVMDAKDVAFTVQKNFEDTLVEVAKLTSSMLKERGIETENLALSGGGVLNCPANSKIVALGLFKHYYASPQPSDGCANSVGRAFRCMEAEGVNLEPTRLKSAYLGVKYPHSSLVFPSTVIREPIDTICEHLKDGGVVGWFQGEAEYGPRALGHRSFLADPRDEKMLCALNKIKAREQWRPLAPVVPEELFDRIFEVENTDMCEFMLRTLKIKERWQPRLKAVCHVDGTTRPQLLKRKINPQLYDLLMHYFELTHMPCLVNTSLNINGFPIVETPRDFGYLAEEISFLDDIPEMKYVFVDEAENLYWDVSLS